MLHLYFEMQHVKKNLDLITSPQAKEKIYRFFFYYWIFSYQFAKRCSLARFLECRVDFGTPAKIALLYFKMEDVDLKWGKRSARKLVFGLVFFCSIFLGVNGHPKQFGKIFEGNLVVWFISAQSIV